MNKEVKTKWLKALRSKKAKQIDGTLKEIDDDGNVAGHCCLGVLCEIHQVSHPGFKWRGDATPTYGAKHASDSTLTKTVRSWAGLSIAACEKLVELNDEDKFTFRQIANYISKEY